MQTSTPGGLGAYKLMWSGSYDAVGRKQFVISMQVRAFAREGLCCC